MPWLVGCASRLMTVKATRKIPASIARAILIVGVRDAVTRYRLSAIGDGLHPELCTASPSGAER